MIHIFSKGETIEGIDRLDLKAEGSEVSVSIDAFLKTANVSFPYIIERILQKDSRLINNNDRQLLL